MHYDHYLKFTSIVNLIESIGETMQMANEDVQSQHVVTVNRSKVMLGTNDFKGGDASSERGDASSGDFERDLNYCHSCPLHRRS